MTFGEELCMISNDISLEERVFEAMKPYLTEIASTNHPKGCQVVIEGASESFTDRMSDLMKKENIEFLYLHHTVKFGRPDCGHIIWQKIKYEEKDSHHNYHDISNQLLRVKLTEALDFSIVIEELDEKYKNTDLYRYIY